MIIAAAKEQATKDYNELYNLVEGKNFVETYNKFNGYDLEMSKTVYGKTNELISLDISFQLQYKSIRTTVFCVNDTCELWETVHTEIPLGNNMYVAINFEPNGQ